MKVRLLVLLHNLIATYFFQAASQPSNYLFRAKIYSSRPICSEPRDMGVVMIYIKGQICTVFVAIVWWPGCSSFLLIFNQAY